MEDESPLTVHLVAYPALPAVLHYPVPWGIQRQCVQAVVDPGDFVQADHRG
ncbi:hypothetical protein D3C72_2134230 [compost metagenome]